MCYSLHYGSDSHTLSAVLLQASGSVFRRLHKRSASHGEELTSGGGLSGSGSGAARPTSAKKASQKAVIKQKKLLFVHFAINRVHCRVTYKVGSGNYCFSCRMQTSRIWLVCPVLVCPVNLQPSLLVNSAVLWCAVLWFAVLCFGLLCCTALWFAVLSCALVCCAVLCIGLLCCPVHWFAVLCSAVLCCPQAMLAGHT